MIQPTHRIVESTLKRIISEAPAQETDNSPSAAEGSLFTPAEEKFLGKFDAFGTRHIGIIYSLTDVGIREFIGRSGKDLNLTPEILLNLIKNKIIRLVPYTGWGRNNDYTIELQLSLDDVKGLGAEDKEKIETGSSGGAGGASAAPEMTPPAAPEVAWVVKYGDILSESVKITKKLIAESGKKTKETPVPTEKTRIIKNLPTQFVTHLEHIIKMMNKHAKTVSSKERLIADILDVLQVEMNLTPKQIQQSYKFHKTQKRLQNYLNK